MMRRLLVVGVVSLGLWIGCSDDDDTTDGSGGSGGVAGFGGTGGGDTGGTGGSDTGGTGGSDTGGTGGSDTGGTGGGGTGELLSNIETCAGAVQVVYPAPGENLQWAASRLTPSSYPADIAKVVLALRHGGSDDCSAELPTKVMVFKGTEVTPNASPADPQEISVSVTSATSGDASYAFDLTSPLKLQTGEHLFVAMQVRVDNNKKTCIVSCPTGGHADRNYWAVKQKAPFDWAKLASFGIDWDFGLKAQAKP
jgi:hypothetical protein